MKHSHLLAIAVLLLSAPLVATAAEESNLDYNFVEVGYGHQHQNTGWSNLEKYDYGYYSYERGESHEDTRLGGYYLSGSIELGTTPLYAFANYSRGNDSVKHAYYTRYTDSYAYEDSWNTDVTSREYSMGLGYHYALNPNINLLAELSFVNQLRSEHMEDYWGYGRTRSYSADGGRLSLGYDMMVTKKLEGWIKASYTEVDHAKGDYSGSIGLQYKLTPMWGITAHGEIAGQTNTYKLGLRANF